MFKNQFLAYSLYQSKVPEILSRLNLQRIKPEPHLCFFGPCRFCSVSAVLLSKWVSVQTTSAGRKTQHGSDCGWGHRIETQSSRLIIIKYLIGELMVFLSLTSANEQFGSLKKSDLNSCLLSVFRGISVVDVERADISFALPLFWSCEYTHNFHSNCCLVCITNDALSWLRLLDTHKKNDDYSAAQSWFDTVFGFWRPGWQLDLYHSVLFCLVVLAARQ